MALFLLIFQSVLLQRLIQNNERSEDSYIGLVDLLFFSGKVLKVSNNNRCAFMHIDAFMNALRYICTFSVQLKSFTESEVNSTLQKQTWK